jgi:hypothetical protein
VADAVLDPGDDAACGGKLALGAFPQFALALDFVVSLGKALGQPVALAAKFRFLIVAYAKNLRMTVGAIKGDAALGVVGAFVQRIRNPHLAFAGVARPYGFHFQPLNERRTITEPVALATSSNVSDY